MDSNIPFPQRAAKRSTKGRISEMDRITVDILRSLSFHQKKQYYLILEMSSNPTRAYF